MHRLIVCDRLLGLPYLLALRSLLAVWKSTYEVLVEWIAFDEMLAFNFAVILFLYSRIVWRECRRML